MELDKYSTVVGTAKSAEQRWFTELTVPSKPREMVLGTQRGWGSHAECMQIYTKSWRETFFTKSKTQTVPVFTLSHIYCLRDTEPLHWLFSLWGPEQLNWLRELSLLVILRQWNGIKAWLAENMIHLAHNWLLYKCSRLTEAQFCYKCYKLPHLTPSLHCLVKRIPAPIR